MKTAYKGELALTLQGPKATSFLQGHRPYLPLAPAACWSAQASLQHLHSFLKQSARPGAGGGLWGESWRMEPCYCSSQTQSPEAQQGACVPCSCQSCT